MTSLSPQDYAQAAPDQTRLSFDLPTFTPPAIPRDTHAVDAQSFHDYTNDSSYPEQPPPHSFQPLDPEIVYTDIPDYVNGGSYQQQPLSHSFHPFDPELAFTDIPNYANGASYPQQPSPHSFQPELAFTDIDVGIGATIDPSLLQTPYATDFHSSRAFAFEQQPPPLLPHHPPQDASYIAPHTLPSTNVNPRVNATVFAPQVPTFPPYPETYPTSMEYSQGYAQSLGYPPLQDYHQLREIPEQPATGASSFWSSALVPPLVLLAGLVYGENNLQLPRLPRGSYIAFEVYREPELAERRQREGANFYGNELLRSSGERFVVRIFGWYEPASSHHTEQSLEDPQSQVVAGVQNSLPSLVSVPEWSVPPHAFSSAPYPPATEEDLMRMINEAHLIAPDAADDLHDPWPDYFPGSF
ncbi:hypothetical protein C8R47DRAFT_454101 [Mycena vitilis]|nr:hypothetical protein C8R47DRAFT_454101 [Mycena vitilis]